MKKLVVIAVSLLLSLGLLTGCDMLSTGGPADPENPGEQTVEKTPLEEIAEKYKAVGSAATIEQGIELTRDGATQYESALTYRKAGSGYQVTGTEKRLNSLKSGKAGAYTETAVERTVKAGTFTPGLDLDELYFTNSDIKSGTLEATVLDGSVGPLLGLTDDLPAPVHGFKLKIVTDETHVTVMEFTYASGGSDVHITLKFSY